MIGIGQKKIRLVVSDEKELYSPFSPEAEFNDAVKNYIRSKSADDDPGKSISLTVFSQEPLDEERFRAATSNWIKEEKAAFKRKEKETLRMLIGLLIFGSAFLLLSVTLQQRFEVLKYSLLPIFGSLSLSKAAGLLIIDMPTLRTQSRLIEEMEKRSVTTFEYVREKDASPDMM